MKGSDYVAVVALYNKAGDRLAAVGETCEHVPTGSLGWLAADRLIQPKGDATAPGAVLAAAARVAAAGIADAIGKAEPTQRRRRGGE